jgi:hypothetical protein
MGQYNLERMYPVSVVSFNMRRVLFAGPAGQPSESEAGQEAETS